MTLLVVDDGDMLLFEWLGYGRIARVWNAERARGKDAFNDPTCRSTHPGVVDQEEAFQAFRGRAPSVDAFFRLSGISD